MHSEIGDLCKRMRAEFDSDSMRAGRLIQQPRAGFLHYAVALSDWVGISWGREHEFWRHDFGIFYIHEVTPDYVDSVDVPYRKRSEILADLLVSPHAFHRQWYYSVRGWNCEHWARLVVSGLPRSYQCKNSWGGVCVIAGGQFENLDAATRLAAVREVLVKGEECAAETTVVT